MKRFDTIRPQKMFRIVRKILKEDEYLIRKHWTCRRYRGVTGKAFCKVINRTVFFSLQLSDMFLISKIKDGESCDGIR